MRLTGEDWSQGFQKIIFVSLSYVVLGLAAGIALGESGFTPFQVFVMSLTVFTGAGQFMAASMVAAGASAIAIIVMTFFLNLRLVLMTSSLSPYVQGQSTPFLVFFGQTTADESYGVNTYQFMNNAEWTPRKALAANIIAWLTWAVSSLFGAVLGDVVNIPTTIINYVLIAMFISMLVDQFTSRTHVLVGVLSGVFAVVLQVLLQNTISIVIATVLASTIGYLVKRQKELSMEEGIEHGK